MPSITFEVDPNVNGKASNYSSLVYVPANSTANQWSGYIDATRTGLWGGTGGAFTGTKCDLNGSRCTFDELQAYLNDGDDNPAKILSVAIVKGKDNSGPAPSTACASTTRSSTSRRPASSRPPP